MGSITIIQGSLFTAPKGSILIHACNCQGVWASGIAAEFAKRFPKARDVYAQYCKENGSHSLGTCLIIPEKNYYIGCLFTSRSFGRHVDRPNRILSSTRSAIKHLLEQNKNNLIGPMHMCKINSGFFKVPWQNTEDVLKESGGDFVVYNY